MSDGGARDKWICFIARDYKRVTDQIIDACRRVRLADCWDSMIYKLIALPHF